MAKVRDRKREPEQAGGDLASKGAAEVCPGLPREDADKDVGEDGQRASLMTARPMAWAAPRTAWVPMKATGRLAATANPRCKGERRATSRSWTGRMESTTTATVGAA